MALTRWQTVEEREIARNPWWTYLVRRFIIPGIHTGDYHFVRTPGSVMIAPRVGDGFLLVRQYRYLNDRVSLEFPAGGVPPGMASPDAAVRELAEETGMAAGSLTHIGEFNPFNGVTDELCQVYLAEQLTATDAEPDPTEEFERCIMSIDEIGDAILDGTLWDGMTLAVWSMLRAREVV